MLFTVASRNRRGAEFCRPAWYIYLQYHLGALQQYLSAMSFGCFATTVVSFVIRWLREQIVYTTAVGFPFRFVFFSVLLFWGMFMSDQSLSSCCALWEGNVNNNNNHNT